MKKAIGVFVGALGMTILLSGSIVLGNAISSQDSKQQKLERIAEDKEKIKVQEKNMQEAKTDKEYREAESELKKSLKDKAKLEVETGTYDYQGCFANRLFALNDCRQILERDLDKSSKEWEKNKVKEMKALYKKYKAYKNGDWDYSQLSKDLNRECDELTAKYAKYEK